MLSVTDVDVTQSCVCSCTGCLTLKLKMRASVHAQCVTTPKFAQWVTTSKRVDGCSLILVVIVVHGYFCMKAVTSMEELATSISLMAMFSRRERGTQ